MAIIIKSDALYSGSAPSITLIGGNDTNQRLLLVCAWNNGDGSAAAALTVGGEPANFVGNRVVAGGVEASISVFEMQNRPAGSYALAITGNGTGTINSADVRWRVIEVDGVANGGGFVSNVLNTVTTQPATLNIATSDVAAGDLVFLYHLVSEGWTAGATTTNTPELTSPQTVNVTSSGAVSAHRSGYFTAAATNPTIANQISGFLTPGGNIDRTTAVAVRFKESAPLPDFTISADFEPGETVTIVAANYPSSPTQITLIDSAANDVTLPLNSAGGNNYTFTMPALPATGSDAAYLRFGSVTAAVGAVSKPSVLQVATTQTLATLASGFDDYVFQGWTPQPVAGDQLVTVTADGIFNSNGDYTFYAEGVYPVWYVDGTGQVYGRTIDTSGLNDPEPTEGSGILCDILQDILQPVLVDVI